MKRMTPEERRAYIRGVLSVCQEFKTPEHIVADVCNRLKIVSEELEEVAKELREKEAKK